MSLCVGFFVDLVPWSDNRYPIAELMDDVPHQLLLEGKHLPNLRHADPFVKASAVRLREWPLPENFDESAAMRNMNK